MITIEKLTDMLTEITNCSEEEVTPEAALKDDLGMDSLDAIALADMYERKLLHTGMKVILAAFGAGLSWNAVLLTI